jgi:hypothetical protein
MRRIAGLHFGCCYHRSEFEVQLRRTTRDLGTRFAKCVEVDGGICGHLL